MIYKDLTRIHLNRLWLIFIAIMLVSGCDCSRNHVDVSGIKVDVTVKRLDRDFFLIDSANFNSRIVELKNKYNDFFPFYCTQISLLGRPDSSERFRDSVFTFLHDGYITIVHDSAEGKFGDFTKQKSDIETGLKYLKYYFPKAKLPNTIITYIGGFSLGAFTYSDSVIGIGLDMYLGNTFGLYQKVHDLPQFVIRKLTPQYIAPNAIHVTVSELFPFNNDGKKLIDNMIYYGKILYIMDKVLPDVPDSIKSGYTQHQLGWCKYNEGEVWKYFIGENLLFSANENDYYSYVSDGPTTSGMPRDAPGNLGSWVGWQIVKKYMDRYPKTTLQQLIAIKDAQKILDDSAYKP